MPPAAPSLAIVIPAYKARFLAAALRSIAEQSDQRFDLFVCDDGSPENLKPIFDSVFPRAGGNATYVRFDQNLGGRSLVEQWNRCVRLTDAQWIWLFSDDDVADADCVRRFRETLAVADPSTDVYRFNTASLDENGRVAALHPAHPARESAVGFLFHRLCRTRASFAVEYVFARRAFDRAGGFVDFPFALGSDDASWITFCGTGEMVLVEGAYVYWRTSTLNTSRLGGSTLGAKLLGLHQFSLWMAQRAAQEPAVQDHALARLDARTLATEWFLAEFGYVQEFIPPRAVEDIAAALERQTGLSRKFFRAKLWQANGRVLAGSLRGLGKRLVQRHV